MQRIKILPEACYEFIPLSREDLKCAMKNNKTVTGFVTKIDHDKNIIEVKFADDVYAILPFDEASIYHLEGFFFTSGLVLDYLINHTIRVKVTYVSDDESEEIYVSRKKSMEEALKYLSDCSSAYCHILQIFKKYAFCDIGCGIRGFVKQRDVCRARIDDIAEIMSENSFKWMNIIKENNRSFYMSYRTTFRPYSTKFYHPGDKLKVTVNKPLDNPTQDESSVGYFVSVTPQVVGILDIPANQSLPEYGQTIICEVKSATAAGLKLRYLYELPEAVL